MDLKRDTWVNGGLYGLAVIGTIVASIVGSETLTFICKPLMMLVLSSWFFFNSRRYGDRFTLMIQVGLFFSLLGDVALMFQQRDEFAFLIGLAAFLLAHTCYCFGFLRNITEAGGVEGLLLSGGLTLVIALVAIWFGWELSGRLDETLKIPVLVYICVISLMAALAAFRYTRTFPRSFIAVLAGAGFFIISDGLLATNRFISPISWAPTGITITYALAQILIAGGCLLHVLDPDTIRRRRAMEA